MCQSNWHDAITFKINFATQSIKLFFPDALWSVFAGKNFSSFWSLLYSPQCFGTVFQWQFVQDYYHCMTHCSTVREPKWIMCVTDGQHLRAIHSLFYIVSYTIWKQKIITKNFIVQSSLTTRWLYVH